MEISNVKLDKLRFPHVAANMETEHVRKLADELRHGAMAPVVQINSLGMVIVGNEICRAAKLAGLTEVPCKVIINAV